MSSAGGPAVDDGPPTVSEIFDELVALEATIDDPAVLEHLDELKSLAGDVQEGGLFGQVIYGFDRHDAAEATLGSVLFGIPMAVEGGTNEVGAYIAAHPLQLLVSLVGTVALVYGILYVAQIQDVRVQRRILGVIPRRLLGVLGVSAVTAVLLLSLWGRVSWQTDPWLAACTTAVALLPMAIGAALGDIVPGS